jgi:hypothetical protein
LDGIARLTNIDNFKFRYYKSFKSIPATLEALEQAIPINANEYEDRINNNQMNNFSNFFNRGFIENVDVLGDDLRFQKIFAESIKMKIKDFGLKKEIHERIHGRLKIEPKDISECIFLTKYLGDYNITKIDNSFIFENNGYAVVLERI